MSDLPGEIVASRKQAAPADLPGEVVGLAGEVVGPRSPTGSRPQETSKPWFLDRIWESIRALPGQAVTNVMEHGNILGRESALETSAKMAAQTPYRPGIGMGEMMGKDWQQNPMLYAGAPSSMNAVGGAMGALARPPARPPPVAAPQPRMPFVQEMPYRGVPQGFRPPETAAGPAVADAIVPEAETSTLASAIASNNPSTAMQVTSTSAYNRAVRGRGAQNAPGMEEQDRRILTSIDQIIENRQNLHLTDPRSGQQVTGQLPQTLRQFSEALDQTKRTIFREYDARARGAGELGVDVDMSPAIRQLRDLAVQPQVADLFPNVASEANQIANNIERRGAYTPEAAQDMIETINQTIKGTFNNPSHETYSHNTLLGQVAVTIRDQLDKAITEATGPGYQTLRSRYGALRSVEKDVAQAAHREAIKTGTLPHNLADIWSGEEIIRGILTLNPTAVARGGAIQAVKGIIGYINSPNRAVSSLFNRRQMTLNPVASPDYRMGMPGLPGQLGGQLGLDTSAPAQRRRGRELRSSVAY